MPYLLNLVYLLLILVSLPWLLVQAVRKGKYREGYAAKLLGRVPRRTALTPDPSPETGEGSPARLCLWLHAVSVGEVNLLAPLLKRIGQERPEWECVISTTTVTGMALARKKYPRQTVFYCPLDFSWAVKAAMRRVRPDVLVLAELELWPNLIRAAKHCGARVAVINGRLGEKSFRGYRRIRPLVASLLRQIDLLAVQDETYAERFRALGARPETVHVTGSMKYDGAQTDRNNPATRRLAALAGFTPDDVVLLAGSTQEPEEEMALAAFRELSPQWLRLRLVLVPRHPDRFEAVAKLLEASGLPWQRRTAIGEGRGKAEGGRRREDARDRSATPASPFPLPPSPFPRVLLVDVVGELGAWWGTAPVAFVGGSLGSRGGQNMIEPAAYAAAVSFGPNTWNFRDVVAAMLAHDAAVVVHDREEFTRFVRRCLEQPEYAAGLGQRAQALVLAQLGATERTLRLLDAPLSSARTADIMQSSHQEQKSVTEAPEPSPQEPIHLKDPAMAGLLAWLIPGLGHWYQGRRAKAVLYFVAIMGLFVFGVCLGGGTCVDRDGGKHYLGYGRAVYFSWHASDKRWNYLCQVGVGVAALPALVQAAWMNHNQRVRWGGFMAPPLPSVQARDNKANPNADQPTRAELDLWLNRRFELAGVFGMIAGLLNVLAIYDACAGPVVLPAKKDEEEDKEEPAPPVP